MKTWNTPLGAQKNCPDFDPCPLCFGCRNYTSYRIKCKACAEEDHKKNICKRELHTEKALSLMLKAKNQVRLNQEKQVK